MTDTIEYLRRCAGRKLLEASLTPEMCRGLVQMIDHLEAERDAALAEVDRITEAGRAHIRRAAAFEAQRDELLVAMHGIGKALGIPEGERSPYSVMCGTLECVNRLAEIDAQEPVAWVPMHPREGALWSMTTATPSEERLPSNYPLSPLYDRPAPAAAPERSEPADGCGACGDACRSLESCRLADESPKPAARPFRCGPDGCSDSTSPPKGGAT